MAASRGQDLEGKGVVILPVGGKGNLDRASIVFAGFGIPTYLIFDGDSGDVHNRDQHARLNRALLGLADLPLEDFPASGVREGASIFADKLETELRDLIGDDWSVLLGQCCEAVGLPLGRDVLKTAYGCREFVERAFGTGESAGMFGELMGRLERL